LNDEILIKRLFCFRLDLQATCENPEEEKDPKRESTQANIVSKIRNDESLQEELENKVSQRDFSCRGRSFSIQSNNIETPPTTISPE
jgi:hypothetical protein